MKTKIKYVKWTKRKLEKFFEDNTIEDDGLFEFLNGREAILDFKDSEGYEADLIIRLRMTEL